MAVKEAAPSSRRINHPSLAERLDRGRTARDRTPPSSHTGWSPAADRPDPVGLLEEQDRTRELCGWTLARAHAWSGDLVATAEYLAGDDAFDQSVTDFGERYADQNEQDYEEFVKAVRSGRLEAVQGV
jgi:Uncharacterized protein conserved in bacteria (DUF2252)